PVGTTLELDDRVRVPVERRLELTDDLALLVDRRLQSRDAVLVGAQALDHELARLELRAQRLELGRLVVCLAGRRAQRAHLFRLFLDAPLGPLERALEILDRTILDLRVGLEAIDGLGVAAQRANELFLAAELRAHALELEVLRADLGAKLRSLLGLGLERVDQLILPVDAPLERLDLVVAHLLA